MMLITSDMDQQENYKEFDLLDEQILANIMSMDSGSICYESTVVVDRSQWYIIRLSFNSNHRWIIEKSQKRFFRGWIKMFNKKFCRLVKITFYPQKILRVIRVAEGAQKFLTIIAKFKTWTLCIQAHGLICWAKNAPYLKNFWGKFYWI